MNRCFRQDQPDRNWLATPVCRRGHILSKCQRYRAVRLWSHMQTFNALCDHAAHSVKPGNDEEKCVPAPS